MFTFTVNECSTSEDVGFIADDPKSYCETGCEAHDHNVQYLTMADMNSPYSKHIWNLLINVGFKLFSSIFVVLVTILSTSGLLGVSSCLTVSILVWCIFCAVVYWGKIDRLPSHRIEKFLENEENGPAIIGHRGGANEAPENTIAALLEVCKISNKFIIGKGGS